MPSTVGTSTTPYATTDPFQRKVFFANGRFWVFYSDGTNMVYRTGTDGETWSDAVIIGTCENGSFFSVFFDGVYVHYVRATGALGTDSYYRRGTPNSDGTITWSADEQNVHSGASDDWYSLASIAVDSDGYVWIGARHFDGADYTPKVLKNDKTDGTWSMASGFPYQLSTTDSSDWHVLLIALTNLKVYVIYARTGQKPLGRLYDAGWGSEETDVADYPISAGARMSAVNEGDDVHFAYLRYATDQVRYNKRVYGTGWQGDELVQDSVTSRSAPTISLHTATGNLYVFWAGSPTAHHIYFKKCVGGTWDSDPTDWIDESTDELYLDDVLTSYYQEYDFKIGLIYTTKTATPWNIKHDYVAALHPHQAMGMMHSGL